MNEQQTEAEESPVLAAYRSHRHELIRFATVLVGADAAQDVVSNVMVRILDRDATIEKPRAYLFQTIANQARNHLRGEARQRRRDGKAAAPGSVPPPDEPYPELWKAVKALSPRQRAIVYLTSWEDLNDAMVAERLGISAGSVRRHLARARVNLRKALDED